MSTRVGQLTVNYSARGIPTYAVELWHDGLKKHRLVRGDSESIVRLKAQLQIDDWAARWTLIDERQRTGSRRVAGKTEALSRTAEAQEALDALAAILRGALAIDSRLNWEGLKDYTPFSERAPSKPVPPKAPLRGTLPSEPQESDSRYSPSLGLLDRVFPSRRRRLFEECAIIFAADYAKWELDVLRINQEHSSALQGHDETLAKLRIAHDAQLAAWEARRESFVAAQAESRAVIDARRAAYEAGEPPAIVEYCELVLSSSRYPEYFPQEFDIDYHGDSKTLVLDYRLPSPEDLPRLKGVKYNATRDDFEEQFISEPQAAKQYDDVLYQIILRTVHELFKADTAGSLEAVVINGIVTALDRTTGKPTTACVLSLRTVRPDFLGPKAINLAMVDPKACFKGLKGVGSSKLHGLSAVAPIMSLPRDDRRFVSAYDVADALDGSVNLAAMDWEDFEHLIRELFEKEFSSTGGEVKVTQASRDGGVDAVAFDPDPIRGGKIVIQAKRYTSTVGVSAVRDLYGTVQHEGASKGVLVTTSDYGPDSYTFAMGKPLVLLSGANLLHMLAKHGHRARIDLREAKSMAGKS